MQTRDFVPNRPHKRIAFSHILSVGLSSVPLSFRCPSWFVPRNWKSTKRRDKDIACELGTRRSLKHVKQWISDNNGQGKARHLYTFVTFEAKQQVKTSQTSWHFLSNFCWFHFCCPGDGQHSFYRPAAGEEDDQGSSQFRRVPTPPVRREPDMTRILCVLHPIFNVNSYCIILHLLSIIMLQRECHQQPGTRCPSLRHCATGLGAKATLKSSECAWLDFLKPQKVLMIRLWGTSLEAWGPHRSSWSRFFVQPITSGNRSCYIRSIFNQMLKVLMKSAWWIWWSACRSTPALGSL